MPTDWPDNFQHCDHPLILHKMSYLRQPEGITHFRDYENLIYELGIMLGYEAVREGLTFKDVDRENDASGATVPKPPRLSGGQAAHWRPGKSISNKPVIVSTVRSGLLLANAMRSIIPTAYMGHVALADDEDGSPFEYMVLLPEEAIYGRDFIIADLFVDRGRTAKRTIQVIEEYGVEPKRIRFVSLIISPEGRDELLSLHYINEIRFFAAMLDAPSGSPDRWIDDFNATNHRLFRTRNRDRIEEKH